MNDWRIFFWAMLHSPEFKRCLIHLPVCVQVRREYASGHYRILALRVGVRSLSVYVPWLVRDAYAVAHGQTFDPFDDIPF